MIRVLEDLSQVDDVRVCLEEAFNLTKINAFNLDEFIQYYDYEDCEIEQERDDEWEFEMEKQQNNPSDRDKVYSVVTAADPPLNDTIINTSSEETLAKSVLDSLDGIGKVMQRSGKKFQKL